MIVTSLQILIAPVELELELELMLGIEVDKPRPKVNPFGDGKPREVLLQENGVDYRN